MSEAPRILPWSISIPALSVALGAVLFAASANGLGQTPPAPQHMAAPARALAPATPEAPAAPLTEHDLSATQEELIKLLRLSPTLTTVVAHDPSLLADRDYVSRNNPQLALFLDAHPEIARNPDFYLFTHVHQDDGTPDQALERAVWPALVPRNDSWSANDVVAPIASLLAFACFLAALVWLIRQFLENRRWSRIFKLQSDVHGKLIEKFDSYAELNGYMETEAGKRFLEADQRLPNALARVLTPLQIGLVLMLLGVGFFMLRHVRREMYEAMLVLGTIALMPGVGFIISAGITWFLAGRLGLIRESGSTANPRLPGRYEAGDRDSK
jgi:hypothetical protein